MMKRNNHFTTHLSLTVSQARIIKEVSEILVNSLARQLPSLEFNPTIILKQVDPDDVEDLILDFNVELQTIIHERVLRVFELNHIDTQIFIDTLKFLEPLYMRHCPKAYQSLIIKLNTRYTIDN